MIVMIKCSFFVQETVSVEESSKEAQLELTDTGSFRPTQTVGEVEAHSSGERGQMKRLSETADQTTGKEMHQ